jgi:hypothetical protein
MSDRSKKRQRGRTKVAVVHHFKGLGDRLSSNFYPRANTTCHPCSCGDLPFAFQMIATGFLRLRDDHGSLQMIC